MSSLKDMFMDSSAGQKIMDALEKADEIRNVMSKPHRDEPSGNGIEYMVYRFGPDHHNDLEFRNQDLRLIYRAFGNRAMLHHTYTVFDNDDNMVGTVKERRRGIFSKGISDVVLSSSAGELGRISILKRNGTIGFMDDWSIQKSITGRCCTVQYGECVIFKYQQVRPSLDKKYQMTIMDYNDPLLCFMMMAAIECAGFRTTFVKL